MSKMSATRKIDRGIIKQPRALTSDELMELRQLNLVVTSEKFKAAQVRGNTALIPRGQEVAAEMEAVAQLLEDTKGAWISAKLSELGYASNEPVTIDMLTGQITRV